MNRHRHHTTEGQTTVATPNETGGDELYVEPPSLTAASSEVDTASETTLGAMRTFEGSAAGRTRGFPGTSTAAFTAAVSSMSDTGSELAQALAGLSESLAAAANGYTATDNTNAENLNLPIPGTPQTGC